MLFTQISAFHMVHLAPSSRTAGFFEGFLDILCFVCVFLRSAQFRRPTIKNLRFGVAKVYRAARNMARFVRFRLAISTINAINTNIIGRHKNRFVKRFVKIFYQRKFFAQRSNF